MGRLLIGGIASAGGSTEGSTEGSTGGRTGLISEASGGSAEPADAASGSGAVWGARGCQLSYPGLRQWGQR